MFSELDPTVVYEDVSSEILEHDDDVVSDLWDFNGRNVYRGSRDPHYKHANVYWLYDENMERVGLTEHSLQDHGDFRVLWFQDTPFGTLFQEDWTVGDNVWSQLPSHVFERFLSEGWTTPVSFLEQFLHTDIRPVTMDMLLKKPMVYRCDTCGIQSLRKRTCGTSAPLDFPTTKNVWFVDDDLILYVPPLNSRVFTWLRPHQSYDGDLPQEQVQEQVPEQAQETQQPLPQEEPLHHDPLAHSGSHLHSGETHQLHHELPLQSRPQTLVPQLDAEEERHEHS